MSKPDPKHTETEQIKADYKIGSINFVEATYDLRQAGHTPAEAQKIVAELIKEKYNGKRDHGHTR